MIIDIHTHNFPEKIAARALGILAKNSGFHCHTDGTRNGLLSSMERCGIDISVVLPVLTSPRQFDSVIRYAIETNEQYNHPGNSPRLISFGGIHPEDPDYAEHLLFLSREGFQGIKLHPNYQEMMFDDIRYMRIIEKASELGLIVITHAGFDPATPNDMYCSPDMILHVLRDVAPEKLILAHMGSNRLYPEVLEKLCGRDVYFDTAESLLNMPEDVFTDIVKAHGADRILFGSDSPWTDQRKSADHLLAMENLSEKEKQQILWGTAARLLKISPV